MPANNNKPSAVYAGTFDPITNGHVDIIRRALPIFGPIRIAVALSPSKALLFSANERAALVRETVAEFASQVTVEVFDGLLVNYVRQLGAKTIIRGLRAISDYEYESQMAMTNREIANDVETVFLMTSDYCSFISSSVVKEVARFKGDLSPFVPLNVAQKLYRHFNYN